MTDNGQHQLYQATYYGVLVRWELVEEIVIMVPEHEREQARAFIVHTLDHIVLETALHAIPIEKHETFMELLQTDYHDEGLLDWLEQHEASIKEKLTEVIRATKLHLKESLSLLSQKPL